MLMLGGRLIGSRHLLRKLWRQLMISKEQAQILEARLADLKAQIAAHDAAIGQFWLEVLDLRLRIRAGHQDDPNYDSH